jgi:type VI secretion system secreted protein VgrG
MSRTDTIGKNHTATVGKVFTLTAGGKSTIVMDDKSILIQIGQSKLVLEENGNITLKGLKLLIEGDEIVDVNSDKIDLN